MYHKSNHPCNSALHQNNAGSGFAAAQLALDGSHGSHTRGVQQGKHQKHNGCERGEHRGQCARIPAKQNGQGRDNALLGGKAGDERRADTPIAKAERCKHRRDKAADGGQQAGVGRGGHIQPRVKGLQEPDQHRGHKDDGESLLQEVPRLLPDQLAHTARRGEAIVGQLHHKGDGLTLVLGQFEEQRVQNAADDAC